MQNIRDVRSSRVIQPESNIGVVPIFAAPLIALAVIDFIILVLGHEVLRTRPTGFSFYSSSRLVMYGHLLFAISSFWAFAISPRTAKGILLGATSLVFSYLIMTQFRGPWAWQGTFEWHQQSQAPWLWSFLVGGLVAIVSLFTLKNAKQKSIHSAKRDCIYLFGLIASSIITFLASRFWPTDSFAAPTLHYALAAISLVFLGAGTST